MKQIETVRDILRLPYYSTDELDLLPQEPGVYFVMMSGSVIYIGKSQNIMQRWSAHHRLEQILGMGDADVHYWLIDLEDTGWVEAEMIDKFCPELNNTPSPTTRPTSIASDFAHAQAVNTSGRFTNDSLIDHLAAIRGRAIPTPTFYNWLSVCKIEPKGRSSKGYTKNEVALLESLVRHLQRGHGYNDFIADIEKSD